MEEMATLPSRVRRVSPGHLFAVLGIVSLPVGFFGGALFSMSLGFGPNDLGGMAPWICGAILTALIAAVAGKICRSRAVFYGFGLFTWLTIALLGVILVFTAREQYESRPHQQSATR